MATKCPKCQSENPETVKFCGECGTQLPPRKETPRELTKTLKTPIKELTRGSTFARRYEIIEELGKGGMGKVYRVFDKKIDEEVALKLIKPEIAADTETIKRFTNELRLARKIAHRNVGKMYELMEEEGAHFITMEYVPGENLKSMIRMSGQLGIGTAVSIAKQVCEGLSEAHQLGVVHRDLKPSNIMIDKEGNARIMDFGIARSLKGKSITGAGVMIGTPEYMSPEQVEGKEVDQRSDVYSLGIILYEMVTGQVPFEGDTPFTIGVKQKSEIPKDPKSLNAQIPQDLSRLILCCLEKDKDRRYHSADEVRTDLEKIENRIPTAERLVPKRKTLTSKQITVQFSVKKALWPVAALIATIIIGFGIWRMIPHRAGTKRAIAVIGFRNRTGDQSLDYLQEAIPNLLITSLEQSGHFRVTSWERLKDLLRQSGRDAAALTDEEAGFEVCRKEGVEALVLGSYIKAGEAFATDVKVLDVADKQILRTASARGEGVSSVLKTQIDEISRTIARGLGPVTAKIGIAQPKISDLTTSSMEAYNYFLRGRDDFEQFYFVDARKFLEKAVSLDPTFAVAYLYLGKVADFLYDTKAKTDAFEMAKKYSEKASEKERLYIEAGYAGVVERNPEKTLRLLEELVKKYPQEKQFHYELGAAYGGLGKRPENIKEYEKAIALDPNFGFAINQTGYAYMNNGDFEKATQYFERYAGINPGQANPIDSIAELYFRSGKFDEAKAKYQEALDIRPDFSSSRSLAYVFAVQEDYSETRHWLEEFISRAPTPAEKMEGLWLRAYYDYFLGLWGKSLSGLSTLKEQASKEGSDMVVAIVDYISGFLYADRGEYDPARKALQESDAWFAQQSLYERTFYSTEIIFLKGWVDLLQGRLDSAQASLKEIEALLPKVESLWQERMTLFSRLLEAEVYLAKNLPEKAIEPGKRITPENFWSMESGVMAYYNLPFLKDVLARAYWKKGDLDSAIAEYQRLTTIDPNIRARYLIHPLYHYRLGRVYEQKGEKAKAVGEYEKFLEYWKDADAGQPEVADARKRLAGLKNSR